LQDPGLKPPERRAACSRLGERRELVAVSVEGLPGRTLVMAAVDLPTLEVVRSARLGRRQAALIAPLDNLVWDRQLLGWLFDFHYRWEVYTPQPKRKYGYYVPPVLYGDRFIARVDPRFDRSTSLLTINNWWWGGRGAGGPTAAGRAAVLSGQFRALLAGRGSTAGSAPRAQAAVGLAASAGPPGRASLAGWGNSASPACRSVGVRA